MSGLSDNYEDYVIEGDERTIINREKALAKLLADGVVYPITRTVTMDDMDDYEETTTAVFVNCNDTFVYSTADGEAVTCDQIGGLLKAHLTNDFGVTKWVSKQRGCKPLPELQDRMKEAGEWDEAMDQLDPNPVQARGDQ